MAQPPTALFRGASLLLILALLLCAPSPVLGAAELPSAERPKPRVLACYWGLDRATDVTFLGFQKHVLNVLEADLCAAITDKHRDGSGAWRDVAKYLDVYEEPRNYDAFISEVRAEPQAWSVVRLT